MKRLTVIGFTVLALGAIGVGNRLVHGSTGLATEIPRTWDDEAIATLEVPLANPVGSPKHVSADYYYRIPVPAIYKSYPVYAPGHEPPGYMDTLKGQEPVIVWDDAGHAPPLNTQAEWIEAGEIVFEAATTFDSIVTLARARDPVWYKDVDTPVASDGTMPFLRYVVRKKGTVEVGQTSCAECHVRVLPNGSVLRGAQGNFNLNRALNLSSRARFSQSSDRAQLLAAQRLSHKAQWSVPWLSPDPVARVDRMSFEELEAANARPAGVAARLRTSMFYPVQIPDLIGVKDRRYLDRTGL